MCRPLLNRRNGTSKPPEIPLKDFFDNPKISDAAISPDGKRLAFLSPENNRLNIWVCDTGSDLASAKAVTHDTERGIIAYWWTRDSSYILFEQDQGGDENFHLYRADPSNPTAKAYRFDTNRRSASCRLLIYQGTAPTRRWWQSMPVTSDISMPTRSTLPVADQGCSKRILGMWTLGLRTGTALFAHVPLRWEQRQRFGCEIQEADHFVCWRRIPMKKALAFTASALTARSFTYPAHGTPILNASSTLDLKTGKETVIDEDPEYDLSEVIISDQTNELLGVGYNRDRLAYKAFNKQFARDLRALEKVHDGEIHFRSSTRDEKRWIIAYDSPNDPGATYLYDRETGQAQFLYRPRPWLPRDALADVKPIKFQSRDGLTIHGYLTVPKGVEAKKLPTVLVVHGGPWARDDWGYDPETQFLANRGFVVLQINYRGSTGYGKRFLHAGDREWGGKMLDDLVDGAEWAVSQGFADRDRLAIYGGSYGGYATLAALAFRPKIFACGIDYVGISNLLTFMNYDSTLLGNIPGPHVQTGRRSQS